MIRNILRGIRIGLWSILLIGTVYADNASTTTAGQVVTADQEPDRTSPPRDAGKPSDSDEQRVQREEKEHAFFESLRAMTPQEMALAIKKYETDRFNKMEARMKKREPQRKDPGKAPEQTEGKEAPIDGDREQGDEKVAQERKKRLDVFCALMDEYGTNEDLMREEVMIAHRDYLESCLGGMQGKPPHGDPAKNTSDGEKPRLPESETPPSN